MPVPRRTIDFSPRLLRIGMRSALGTAPRAISDLERALEQRLEVPHVVATASGRAALAAILAALAPRRDRPVLVPALTDESVPRTVADAGFAMRFVDADLRDANPDADQIATTLAAGPASVVIAAHHFGRVADMDGITAAASRAGVPVVEDATHAVGAQWHDRPVGTLGAAGYLSFNFTKPLSGFGGGAVLTEDPALAAEVRRWIATQPAEPRRRTLARLTKGALLWALTRRTVFSATLYPVLRAMDREVIGTYKRVADRPGGTKVAGPMSEISATLLLDRLEGLPSAIASRRARAQLLDDALDPRVPRLTDRTGSRGVAYFYVVRTGDRRRVAQSLLRAGIDCGEAVLRDVAAIYGVPADFPHTRQFLDECLQVPIHPETRSLDLLEAARILNDAHPAPHHRSRMGTARWTK